MYIVLATDGDNVTKIITIKDTKTTASNIKKQR